MQLLEESQLTYLTRERYLEKIETIDDIYWDSSSDGRWIYLIHVIEELKKLTPKTVLELGSYKINLTNVSDNMDINPDFIDIDNANNKQFIQDASILPWDIADKYYDVFIGLQVFEHLGENQSDIFKEVMRISKHAIISLPYLWDKPDDPMHHMIDDEKIKMWTNNVLPEKIIYIKTPGSRKRVIYFFEF